MGKSYKTYAVFEVKDLDKAIETLFNYKYLRAGTKFLIPLELEDMAALALRYQAIEYKITSRNEKVLIK